MRITFCPVKGLDYIDFDGHKRYLASKASGGRMKQMLPSYRAAGNPMFDRKDWQPIIRHGKGDIFDYIFDQNGHGSCVGNGWTGGLMRARVILGMTPQILSPGYWYSLINGGSDNGAVISDGIDSGMQIGTCLFSTVGQDPIYTQQMPSGAKTEAARFKIKAAYHAASYDELGSALQTGRFIAVYGYQVGNNFMSFDKYGVAGHDRGPGNHCNHADGMTLLPDGRWVMNDVNSWNKSFGAQGRCYIDEQHLFGGGDQADVCVIEAATDDPNDPNQPPAVSA